MLDQIKKNNVIRLLIDIILEERIKTYETRIERYASENNALKQQVKNLEQKIYGTTI